MAGFRSIVREKVELLVATDRKLDFQLELGEVNQSIVVSEAPPALNTQDATVGNAFNEQEVKELPFLARNVVNLLTLQPGVVFTGNSDTDRLSQGDISTLDGREGVVNGVRGVSSGSAPTVMPRNSGPPPWNRDGGSGVFWPRATVNSPFVAVTLSVSE